LQFIEEMINPSEQDERTYLEEIKEKILLAIKRTDERVREFAHELQQKKEYIYENQSGMDEADHVAADQSINRISFTGENAVVRRRKLVKLAASPYFGRIDFNRKGADTSSMYIGMYTFTDETTGTNLIYDWRSPVASMFYDFELGEAWYETPNGKVEGELSLKRQYKIRDGKMEFVIENSVSITDELLQKELSKSADDKMKNIVATIQRDQNAVIRNESASVMIIQGVAGSGKTSIALHRIAFLLYRHRESIKARNVLIISPNKVFSDYISNVLPELGEEHIPETGMEDLAREVLENKFSFQTFFQQVAYLLEQQDHGYIERIRFKSSFDFLKQLNRFFIHIENNYFQATELRVAGVIVPGPWIQERFRSYSRMPMLKRLPEVVQETLQHVRHQANRKLTGHEKSKIWEAIPRMFRMPNVLDLYKEFYRWVGKPEMFRLIHGNKLEYADVFPLIYCAIRLEGVKTFDHVRHLLIDEMQDYTPVQYAVISRLFTCKKTIMGDIRQTVNPYGSSTTELIEEVFPMAETIRLFKSYRSTSEITSFTQRVIRTPELVSIHRSGAMPSVIHCSSSQEEVNTIRTSIEKFRNSGYASMGIICKTKQQAKYLYDQLQYDHVHLLTAESTGFKPGVVITTVHISKGLEFDVVVVPFASARSYHSEMDRGLLYIACTRAMHELTLTHTGEVTKLIDPVQPPAAE
jgi:DNA helicase-2/ATP-dependent DNA helicase PcrA